MSRAPKIQFDFTVVEGKGRLNPSRDKKLRQAPQFHLCDLGWCVHILFRKVWSDVQNKWDANIHTYSIKPNRSIAPRALVQQASAAKLYWYNKIAKTVLSGMAAFQMLTLKLYSPRIVFIFIGWRTMVWYGMVWYGIQQSTIWINTVRLAILLVVS